MYLAVALVANSDQVLGDVERTPRWITEVVRFGRWPQTAAFTLTAGTLKHLGADLQKPWMLQVFGVSAIRRIARPGWRIAPH
jgi:hypothetical protein